MNTFKYGLPKDSNDIYNSLTRVPPHTFYELLSRVKDYARVEDDAIAVGMDQGKMQGVTEETVMESLISPRGRERKIFLRSAKKDIKEFIRSSQNPFIRS